MTKNHTYIPDSNNDFISVHNGKPIKTIKNPNINLNTYQEHIIYYPELCPASKNPLPGSYVKISYKSINRFLEVFSLEDYIKAYIGHKIVRDVEYLTQEIAKECAIALNIPLKVEGYYKLNRIEQEVITIVEIDENTLKGIL